MEKKNINEIVENQLKDENQNHSKDKQIINNNDSTFEVKQFKALNNTKESQSNICSKDQKNNLINPINQYKSNKINDNEKLRKNLKFLKLSKQMKQNILRRKNINK